MSADTSKNGVQNPVWTCPNCQVEKFNSQRAMIEHALPCKRGELDTLRAYLEEIDDDRLRLIDEERRLRYFLSIRVDEEGYTLLQRYDSINPDWIDAMQFGASYEMPPLYRGEP